MANLRIKDITAMATTFIADEYIAIDGATNDVQKITLDNLEAQIRNGVNDTEMAILDGATLSTAELNILDNCTATATELNYLAGVTPGTASASKALVLDASKDGDLGRNVTASGTLAVTGAVTSGGLLTASAGLTMLTGDFLLTGNNLILDADADSKFLADDDDILQLWLGGVEEYRWDSSNFGCATAGANNLGGALGVDSATAANCWNNLNLNGNIYMGETAAPASATIDGSCVIYQDSATGNLVVKLRHSGGSKTVTLASYA